MKAGAGLFKELKIKTFWLGEGLGFIVVNVIGDLRASPVQGPGDQAARVNIDVFISQDAWQDADIILGGGEVAFDGFAVDQDGDIVVKIGWEELQNLRRENERIALEIGQSYRFLLR